MKVAFILNQFPAISQTFIIDQITGLLDLGVDVEIFADSRAGTDKAHPDVRKYRLEERTHYSEDITKNKLLRIIQSLDLILRAGLRHPIRVLRFVFLLLIRAEGAPLRTLCRIKSFFDRNFDIVHCHFGPNGVRALDLKEMGIKGKIITTFHGYDANRYPMTAGKDVYKRLFKEGDIFTANTNYTKQQVVALGCQESKIRILPVGLRIDRFTFELRSAKLREPVKILTVGRLVEKKGHQYVIKALKKLITKYPDITYLIAGDGDLKDSLHSLVAELQLEQHVRFLGALDQDEVLDIYQQADIFVLASVTASDGDREGQGLVLQEAQASGLPVISTIHNGIPEGVLDGKSGFLVPERNVEALEEKLGYLIGNPEIWPEMGKCGCEFVRKNYDIRKLNEKLLRLYEELLS